ncbi:glycosyltransferase family 2 protein [Vibrio sp. 1CM23M]|uniref:glycosyltransferase family A protein n=1 Tax=Vibrio sp. 1CM23M TaxID=2929164 RepID=UPI0020BED032|nr:glycosyltransferase family 2 protein [Vibrio sp. 1CM23M]MCK8073705.1 glycosyltransferase family 2 protein [Vibrio sp. 1CM23M]
MNTPLVSVISPCYNGEKYIGRFLESILYQDYDNIELIVVDDGSTDNTLNEMYSYEPLFIKKGYKYTILSQRNQGQASAINLALPLVTGEYITWPDSDDILTKCSISSKVKYLTEHDTLNVVRSDVEYINENSSHLYYISDKYNLRAKNIFEDLIFENEVYLCPGGYMIRTSCFDKVIRNRRIINSKVGQNWQILLPICRDNDCGYLDKVTYRYVVREGSHSRSSVSYFQKRVKFEGHQSLLLEIIRTLGAVNYTDAIRQKYVKKFIYLAVDYGNFREAFTILRNNFSFYNVMYIVKAALNRYRK